MSPWCASGKEERGREHKGTIYSTLFYTTSYPYHYTWMSLTQSASLIRSWSCKTIIFLWVKIPKKQWIFKKQFSALSKKQWKFPLFFTQYWELFLGTWHNFLLSLRVIFFITWLKHPKSSYHLLHLIEIFSILLEYRKTGNETFFPLCIQTKILKTWDWRLIEKIMSWDLASKLVIGFKYPKNYSQRWARNNVFKKSMQHYFLLHYLLKSIFLA